jgi:putative phosphoesterase
MLAAEVPRQMRIGLISDTHGLLRPAVHDAFAGVSLILHAGDVGGSDILEELGGIAPVRAVFGNTDPPDDYMLRAALDLEFQGYSLHVSHGHEVGAPTPEKLLATYPADIIVYGHTHRQLLHREGKRLVVNPGAAGQRRFELLPSVAILVVARAGVDVEFVEIE